LTPHAGLPPLAELVRRPGLVQHLDNAIDRVWPFKQRRRVASGVSCCCRWPRRSAWAPSTSPTWRSCAAIGGHNRGWRRSLGRRISRP